MEAVAKPDRGENLPNIYEHLEHTAAWADRHAVCSFLGGR